MGVADLQQPNSLPKPRLTAGRALAAGGSLRSLLLILLLSLAAGVVSYQAPPAGRVAVGWLGDRLFLDVSPGLGTRGPGDLYADDLTPGSPTWRSRWTRQQAEIVFPNLGRGADLQLTVVAQGWPDDVLGAPVEQPDVLVRADGAEIGRFTPGSGWSEHQFRIPAGLRSGADLTITLESSHAFTDTASFGADPRPKGLRLAELRVAATDSGAFLPPAPRALALLMACAALLFLLFDRLLAGRVAVVYTATALGCALAALGLALARIWMGAALELALAGLAVALALSWQGPLLAGLRGLLRRFSYGPALGYGLVSAALVLLGYAIAQLFVWLGTFGRPLFWQIFPDSLLYGLLAAGLLALGLVLGRRGLPRLSDSIVSAIGSRRGATILLALFAAVWVGYEAAIILRLPYVGHADYADNAVVARNLVAGRGWVVDYVTQFFRLEDDLTRPQETWPLLQPVWIAPFFALLGPSSWAARLPNLLFNLLLLLLIYRIGARIWDRRVGLTAAIFVLTNYLFFRLTIYVTSDLAFVVISVAAIYCLYRAVDGGRRAGDDEPRSAVSRPAPGAARAPSPTVYLLASGALVGLMMLQKPSGAMIALGMGLWLLAMQHAACSAQNATWAWARELTGRVLRTALPWTLVALVVLSPYLVRNYLLFGRPVFSTESYDAWVLGYRGTSGDAWAEIYRVFAPELGGPGLPDATWVLRWGFDATIAKFETQVRELRNYLMPTWSGLPGPAGQIFSQSNCATAASCKNILSDVGAWLALIGAVAGLRARRRLLGLLGMAYAPYIAFMLTYWRTDEERYWVILLPWLALLAAWTIWGGYDKLAAVADRRWAPLGLILALVAAGAVVGYSRGDIADKVRNEPQIWAPDLAAYAWLDANLPPGAPVMTRSPWQLNWHTGRPALMIPNTGDRALLLEIARHYGAEYIVFENQLRVKGDAGRLLAPLMANQNQVGQVIDGFELIYASDTADFRAFIYRIPDSSLN